VSFFDLPPPPGPPDKPSDPESSPPPGPPPRRAGVCIDTLADTAVTVGGNIAQAYKQNRHWQVGEDQNSLNVGNVQSWVYGHKFESVNGCLTEYVTGTKTEKLWGVQSIINFINLDKVCLGIETRTNIIGVLEQILAFKINITQAYERQLNPLHNRKIAKENEEHVEKTATVRMMKFNIGQQQTKVANAFQKSRTVKETVTKLKEEIGQFTQKMDKYSAAVESRLKFQASVVEKAAGSAKLALKGTVELSMGGTKVVVYGGKVTVSGTNVVVQL
jgi:hypothetical protein